MKPPIEYRPSKAAAPKMTEAEVILARIRAKTKERVRRYRAAKKKAKK